MCSTFLPLYDTPAASADVLIQITGGKNPPKAVIATAPPGTKHFGSPVALWHRCARPHGALRGSSQQLQLEQPPRRASGGPPAAGTPLPPALLRGA